MNQARDEDLCGLFTPTAGVPLTGVRVTGDILGRGARVRVAQRFRNREKQPVEAVYRFPLPEGSAVCGFRARIGDRTIQGAVEEREKAFELYDRALEAGHGGYLLDEERPNIFTLSVGNLNPGAEVLVELDYVTLLDAERNAVRFVLPTTIAPRYIPADMEEEEGIPAAETLHPPYAEEVPYGLSIDLAVRHDGSLESVESPSHPIRVDLGSKEARVSLSAEEARMDRDFLLTIGFRDRRPNRVWLCRDDRGAFLQVDLTPEEVPEEEAVGGMQKPAETAAPTAPAGREIVFVVDCSGSMQGSSIREARRALEVCLKALSPGDRFNIYRFGSRFETLFPRAGEYTEESLRAALAWLPRVEADLGGTELLAPLEHLYAGPPDPAARREVILLTDGEVGNEERIVELVRRHRLAGRLFAVAIGMGPNEHLINAAARAGGGASERIQPGERIEPKVLRLFHRLNGRSLEQVALRWNGGPLEQAPAEAAALGAPLTLLARAAGGPDAAPADRVTVCGLVEGREWSWELPVVELPPEGLPAPVLWARERIRDLEESGEALSGRGSRRDRRRREGWMEEVVRISREYGVLSRLTSFVAIEEREEKDRTTGETVLRKVPALVTFGWHGGEGRAPGATVGVPPAVSFAPRRTASRHDVNMSLVAGARSGRLPASMSLAAGVQSSPPAAPPPPRWREAPGAEPPPAARPPASDRTDLLLDLLALQRAGGGFDLPPQAAGRLGIDRASLEEAARAIEGVGEADRLLLLSTALVLQILAMHFAAERPTWFAVAAKSRAWLASILAGRAPRIRGRDLAAWVEERVRAEVRLPAG
jgi:Ca-activated chloride channel family protein